MIHVFQWFWKTWSALVCPRRETQSNSDSVPEQPIEDQVLDAIHGSNTKREPRFTPRILPEAGSQRRVEVEVLKRFDPEEVRSSFCSSGSHAFVSVEIESRTVRRVGVNILKVLAALKECCKEINLNLEELEVFVDRTRRHLTQSGYQLKKYRHHNG